MLDEVSGSLRLGQGVQLLPELHGFLEVVSESLHDRPFLLRDAS